MVKLKNYSAFIWLNVVAKRVSPPTAIRKMMISSLTLRTYQFAFTVYRPIIN